MKKRIFYGIASLIFLSEACQTKSTPKIGDAVLYEYIVKQGDSIVYKSALQFGDTATIIIENTNNYEPAKRVLVERIMKMSENDSLSFDVNKEQKGFLQLNKIITAAEFPRYIEEGNKKQMVFEQRLEAVKKELVAAMPFYKSRQKSVVDSATLIFEQFKKGQLKDKLQKMDAQNAFYVVKGNGKILHERKKWVWFHCITLSPEGKTMSTYGSAPRGTNLVEFPLNEALERGAGNFEEGSITLLAVPNSVKIAKDSAVSNKTLFWIEVVKVLNF